MKDEHRYTVTINQVPLEELCDLLAYLRDAKLSSLRDVIVTTTKCK